MYDDDYEEDWDDAEDWDQDDETIPCPACGVQMYDDADVCPACGEFLIRDTSVLAGKPRWYVLIAVLGVIVTIMMLSGLMRLL